MTKHIKAFIDENGVPHKIGKKIAHIIMTSDNSCETYTLSGRINKYENIQVIDDKAVSRNLFRTRRHGCY